MKLTSHHLLAKSKGGSGIQENRKGLSESYHRAFHRVFENDTPIEQIIRILEINDTCLQWDFKQDIIRILNLYWKDIYHLWIKK